MARNIRLASIYVKIHNKKTLTVDDLAFLAMFDPECFRKTCKNLVYNLPKTEVLMEESKSDNNFCIRARFSSLSRRTNISLRYVISLCLHGYCKMAIVDELKILSNCRSESNAFGSPDMLFVRNKRGKFFIKRSPSPPRGVARNRFPCR